MKNNLYNIRENLEFIIKVFGNLYSLSVLKIKYSLFNTVNLKIKSNVSNNIINPIQDTLIDIISNQQINKSIYNQIKNNYIKEII